MRNAIVGSFAGFVLAAAFVAACGGGGGAAPQADLEGLTQQVAALQADLATTRTDLAQARSDIAALEELLQHVSRSGNDLYVTGANLHIRSGAGATDASVNGLGNVIIGYNEGRDLKEVLDLGDDDRTGSHMLVLGQKNNYSSYGGVVAGTGNATTYHFASVLGGRGNEAGGVLATVSGGLSNRASASYASVTGGESNDASSTCASVTGGYDNDASAKWTSVSGGEGNQAYHSYASISGGMGVTTSSQHDHPNTH